MVQMLERSQSLLMYCNNIVSLQDWYSTDHGSHTPLQERGHLLNRGDVGSAEQETETDNCQNWL